jgi:hypothetical protein
LRVEDKDVWKAALMVRWTAKMMVDPWEVAMGVLMVVRRVADLAVLMEYSLDDEIVEQKKWKKDGMQGTSRSNKEVDDLAVMLER